VALAFSRPGLGIESEEAGALLDLIAVVGIVILRPQRVSNDNLPKITIFARSGLISACQMEFAAEDLHRRIFNQGQAFHEMRRAILLISDSARIILSNISLAWTVSD
jgi:hypothetical protein